MIIAPVSIKLVLSPERERNVGTNIPKATRAGWGFLVAYERRAIHRARKLRARSLSRCS
jgi:hypothetical protein